jgi:hypothetical protein
MYDAENVSKIVSHCLYKEDVSRDIESVPLQSLSASFAFQVGIRGISAFVKPDTFQINLFPFLQYINSSIYYQSLIHHLF